MYTIEKDWITDAGFRAVGILGYVPSSHRCGYVGVPPTHPLYRVEYTSETDVLVAPSEKELIGRRGIVSAYIAVMRGLGPRPEDVFDVHGSLTYSGGDGKYPVPSDLWWVGFDCAHARDYEDGGRSLDYVVQQCESLTTQIKEKVICTPPKP